MPQNLLISDVEALMSFCIAKSEWLDTSFWFVFVNGFVFIFYLKQVFVVTLAAVGVRCNCVLYCWWKSSSLWSFSTTKESPKDLMTQADTTINGYHLQWALCFQSLFLLLWFYRQWIYQRGDEAYQGDLWWDQERTII